MIMVLTHRSDLRNPLNEVLQANGYSVAIPSHREERLSMLIEYRPVLIVLDLYVSDPSGTEQLKELREHGYRETVILLSGLSMMSVLKEAYASGITKVISIPAYVKGRYLLGELQAAVRSCMQEIHAERHKDALVAALLGQVPWLEIGIQQHPEHACRIHHRGRTEGMLAEPQNDPCNQIIVQDQSFPERS